MKKHSPLFRQVVLTLAVLAVLGAMAWGWMRLFEPVPVPPVPPAKTRAFFDPRADIRENPLFLTLVASFRDDIEPGPLGRVNPFDDIGAATQIGANGVPTGLGTVREFSLEGALARALARAKDGSMLALVEIAATGGQSTYEIRRLVATDPATVVARWTGPSFGSAGNERTIPVAMRQDMSGRTWLLSQGGVVGSIQSAGTPSWNASPVFSSTDPLSFLFSDIQLDGSGRFWVTDGTSVAAGDGTTFQVLDMVSQLSDADRVALGLDTATPEQVRTMLRPWQLQPHLDGRMMVVSQLFSATFPITLQGRPEIVTASTTPGGLRPALVKASPEGDMWSVLFDGAGNPVGMSQRSTNSSREFRDPIVLPKQALRNMLLLTSATQGLAALDYTPTASVLWATTQDGWVAQVLVPVSAQPNDTAERVAVDGQGNVWAILRQKGLLLAQPPRGR